MYLKQKIFFCFCICFISGIFLSAIFSWPFLLKGLGLFVSLILIFILGKYRKMAIIGFCLLFLVLGVWRYQVVESKINNNSLRDFNDLEQDVVIVGRIVKEPDVRFNSQKLTLKPKSIFFAGREYKNEKWGWILVSYRKYPEYKYGDVLKVIGKMETPAVFEDFNYKDYLAKSGIYSVVYWSEIEFLERNNYGGLVSMAYAKILDFKNKLRKSIHQNLSLPQSSILGAIILGDKSRMSDELKEKLNIIGIRHITAVSGLHITIISTILMSLLLGLGFYRGQAFYLSIIFIILFIIMIGLPSSAIRAGIMVSLYLLGQKIGRKSFSPRSIVIAAALMLAFNPLLLLGDVGFQLSFLAVMGIIYLKDSLDRLFRFIKLKALRDIISMTLSAQIFTLPVLVYNFGRISLIAPLINVLILPIVPFIMILGFVMAMLGIAWSLAGWIISFPVWFLLTYLVKVMDLFSQSWAAKTFDDVHWFWLIFSYLILGFFVWRLNRKKRLKFLDF